MPADVHPLEALLRERIVVLDGAMGTMIQRRKLSEQDYRGKRFRDWKGKDLKGSLELLQLTQPHVVEEIHTKYLEAGADVIETNTFSATTIGLHDFLFSGEPSGKRKDQEFFQRVVDDVDLLAVETIFDTLNAKAALFAIAEAFEQSDKKVPLLISGTVTDKSGRTLGGQTVEAFLTSVAHAEPLILGLNCALGPDEMEPHIEELSRISPYYLSAYPNAGLPDPLSETGFPETPQSLAPKLAKWAENGWLNLVGGCCGTTPDHIRAVKALVKEFKPRNLFSENGTG